jgi:DNA repair protein RecN (Recombination protein N)
LDQRARVLGHAVTLMHDGTQARDALIGTDDDEQPADAMSATMEALRALDRIATIDDAVAPVQQAVRDAQHALGEASSALEHYLSDIDADPTRLQQAEERRRALADLKRRYGPTLDDVLQWRSTAASELELVDTHDELVAGLQEEIAAGEERVRDLAAQISTARAKAAETLAAAVTVEMQSLAMAGSQFIVDLHTAADVAEFTESGADRVVFTMIAHPGSPQRPLAKGASGGELARVMLALEVVLAGGSSVPTFVFDEVDAGVGGRAAVEVGKRLANLAGHAQVLVVTHLPQVAAFADHHVVVEKNTDGLITATGVRTVTEDARVAELVRMLSGLPDSEVGADHAREMLASAQAERVAARQTVRR